MGNEGHQVKETVRTVVVFVSAESLARERLTRRRHMEDVGSEAVEICRRETAYVAIEVRCIWKVVSVDRIGGGVEIERRDNICRSLRPQQTIVEASDSSVELYSPQPFTDFLRHSESFACMSHTPSL